MAIYIQDRQTYKATARDYTPEGFLRVPGRVAKTGTQQYLRRELGLDGDPNGIVTVYRPESEVFKDESLGSFHIADVTFHHPSSLVDSNNFKSTTVGVVDGPGRRDGDFVVCDLVIKDATAIKQIEAGVAELSAGYTAEYVPESGVTADGVAYDFVQRDIKINHVAIVPVARAGRQARVFDNQPKGKSMQKVTLDSGRTVDIEDAAVALLVTDSIERLNQQISEAESKLQAAQATIDAQKERIVELEKENDEDEIKEKVEKVTKTRDAAILIAGPSFTCDSVDVVEIQRAALAVVRPSVAWADKDAAYVAAAYDFALETAKEKPAADKQTQMTRFAADAAKNSPTPTGDGEKMGAYERYKAQMQSSNKREGA